MRAHSLSSMIKPCSHNMSSCSSKVLGGLRGRQHFGVSGINIPPCKKKSHPGTLSWRGVVSSVTHSIEFVQVFVNTRAPTPVNVWFEAESLRLMISIAEKHLLQQVLFSWCAQHGRLLVGESPIRGLIVPTVSLRQGCPSWDGIWRKSAAKLRSEEHEPHTRHIQHVNIQKFYRRAFCVDSLRGLEHNL